MLRSVDEIVAAVGGTGDAAEIAGVRPSAVSEWKKAGFIPSRHFFVFAEALATRGKVADRAAFGFRPPAEVPA